MDPSSTTQDRAWRRPWRIVLLATLVSSIGGGLTLPFLVVYLHSIRHVSLPVAGLIVGASAVASLVAGPVGGSLGDRLGVGRLLVAGSLANAAGTALLAAAHGPGLAVVAVTLVGIGNAVAWTALNAVTASLLPASEGPRGFALRFGTLNAGLGIGALVAGWVVSLHHPGTFEGIYLVDAGSTLVATTVFVLALRRHPAYRRVRRRAEDDGGGPEGYRAVLADRRFLAFLACSVLLQVFGYAQLDGSWAAFATSVVHASPRIVGLGFAVNTAVIVAAQLGVAHLTRRWRRSRLLAAVGGMWTLAWLVTGLADLRALAGLPSDVALAVSLGVFGLGETLYSPVSGALPNELAPDHLRVRYNALASTMWSVGGLVGPPVAGLLLGSATPVAWVFVIAAGTIVASVAGLRLAHHLPPDLDRPPLAGMPAASGVA